MRYSRGLDLPSTLDELVDPSRAALLVYDMQVGICRQVADAPRISSRVAELVAAARSRAMRIVYTCHRSPPRPWLGATQLRTAMRWQRQADPEAVATPFGQGAAAAAIVPELAPHPDHDLVIDKFAMSAFEGTVLATALRDCRLSTLIVCGIALEVGIDPTLRHAADLGFVPVLATDACGAGNVDAGARALAALAYAGDMVEASTSEIIGAVGGALGA